MRVVGLAPDELVELEVGLDVDAQVVVRGRLVHRPQCPAQGERPVGGDVAGRLGHGQPLEHEADLVQLLDVALADLEHVAPVRAGHDQPRPLELDERLADRNAADPERARELVLDEPRPGPQAAVQDAVADERAHVVREPGPLEQLHALLVGRQQVCRIAGWHRLRIILPGWVRASPA